MANLNLSDTGRNKESELKQLCHAHWDLQTKWILTEAEEQGAWIHGLLTSYLFNSNYGASGFISCSVNRGKLRDRKTRGESGNKTILCLSCLLLRAWRSRQGFVDISNQHALVGLAAGFFSPANERINWRRSTRAHKTTSKRFPLPTWPSPRKSSFSYRLALDFTSSAMIANCRQRAASCVVKGPQVLVPGKKKGCMLTNSATYRQRLFLTLKYRTKKK